MYEKGLDDMSMGKFSRIMGKNRIILQNEQMNEFGWACSQISVQIE